MRIRVTHTIDDLADDLRAIPAKAKADLERVVEKHVVMGNKVAQGFARRSSGPHGRLYYKRITSEMTGPLEGEFGPRGAVAGVAVGAGWRHGPPNTDLARAADVIGPKFARAVSKLPDKWFW